LVQFFRQIEIKTLVHLSIGIVILSITLILYQSGNDNAGAMMPAQWPRDL